MNISAIRADFDTDEFKDLILEGFPRHFSKDDIRAVMDGEYDQISPTRFGEWAEDWYDTGDLKFDLCDQPKAIEHDPSTDTVTFCVGAGVSSTDDPATTPRYAMVGLGER